MGNAKRAGSLIVMLLLSACAEEPLMHAVQPQESVLLTPLPSPVVSPVPSGAQTAKNVITVKEGDTLYSLGVASGFGYQKLSAWNHIPKPYKLLVGQKIKLYDPEQVVESVEMPPVVQPVTPAPPAANPVVDNSLAPDLSVHEPAAVTAAEPTPMPSILLQKSTGISKETLMLSKDKKKVLKLYWKWPLEGKIVKPFSPGGNKGIDIHAKDSAAVVAAADGEVVYSGNGLIGYGNLIILKHDEVYLSAYANVAALRVDEGQKVTQGEAIAQCAATAPTDPSLHFEIRKNGKAVNPLIYLPAQ